MKIILFTTLLFTMDTASIRAQCGKNLTLTSTKTEYLDASGVLQKTEEEKSWIDITKSEIVIVPGNDQRKITGIIKSDTCSWTTPFKEGKTILKATLKRDGEDPLNATITIEGKDAKLTMLIEIEEMPDRKIRAVIQNFEEKK